MTTTHALTALGGAAGMIGGTVKGTWIAIENERKNFNPTNCCSLIFNHALNYGVTGTLLGIGAGFSYENMRCFWEWKFKNECTADSMYGNVFFILPSIAIITYLARSCLFPARSQS